MVRFTFGLMLVVASSSRAAEPTAMFISKAINLEPAQVVAVGTVCAAQYARVTDGVVLAPTEAQAAVKENGNLRDAAQTLNAREYVELSVVYLGSAGARGRLLLDASRRGADGAELYHADLAADSLDDVVPACERLALSLTKKVPVAETMTRHNVTAAEARASRRPNRVGSERVFGVKTGFGHAFGSNAFNPLATIAFNARLETERFFVELGAGALIPAVTNSSNGSYGGLNIELGASYYLMDTDLAPYVGLGVQPRILFSSTYLGLAPYAQAGLMLWRHSSTRIYVDARVSQNVLPMRAGYGTEPLLYPTELSLQVGVGF